MNLKSIGNIVAIILALITIVTGAVIRDRQLMNSINEGRSELHDRINTVKENYVRRDDLKDIKNLIKQYREEQRIETRGTNRRIDEVLVIISK